MLTFFISIPYNSHLESTKFQFRYDEIRLRGRDFSREAYCNSHWNVLPQLDASVVMPTLEIGKHLRFALSTSVATS